MAAACAGWTVAYKADGVAEVGAASYGRAVVAGCAKGAAAGAGAGALAGLAIFAFAFFIAAAIKA